MFSQPHWCCSIPGAEVPLPGRPLHHCCLFTSPSAFRLISGIMFQLDVFCHLQEWIFSPIPHLVFINDLYYYRSCKVSSQFFQIQQLLLPKLIFSHNDTYVLTIKLQSGGETVNVYIERKSGQTFSCSNLHNRKNSSSHSLYELNKTLLTYRKTVFLPLSACTSRSLCFPVRCCWFHQNISSFSSVFQRNTRLTSSHALAIGYTKTRVFIYTYKVKKCFSAFQKYTCAKTFFLKWSHHPADRTAQGTVGSFPNVMICLLQL